MKTHHHSSLITHPHHSHHDHTSPHSLFYQASQAPSASHQVESGAISHQPSGYTLYNHIPYPASAISQQPVAVSNQHCTFAIKTFSTTYLRVVIFFRCLCGRFVD
jgi:hypothetical protein